MEVCPIKGSPAYDASRGMNFKQFVNTNRWFQDPKFLWKPQSSWDTSSVLILLQPENPELKKQVKTKRIAVEDNVSEKIEEKGWLKMKRIIIVLIMKWKMNTERKKEMMLRRSEKALDFSINDFN